jgi:sugar/nucleoside kinase (ribokinase family)
MQLKHRLVKQIKFWGGAATYIGLAASVMKTDVSLVSVIGGDFPQEYLDMMTGKGINIDGVEMIKEGKTFFWSGKYQRFEF